MRHSFITASLVLLGLGLIVYILIQPKLPAQPQAVAGVLDLRRWDFAQDEVVNLNGEWEFYWQQLITSASFGAATPPTPTGMIQVPRTWRGYLVNGQPLGGAGYATYRLTILISPNATPGTFLALKMPIPVNTAHRLYLDGQLLGSAGQVGTSASTTTPRFNPYVAVFAPTGERIEILLQIANFYHEQGGLIEPIRLGSQMTVHEITQHQLGRDLFLIGGILIMGLYHLGLFVVRRREQAPLYFCLFCLMISGVTLLLWQPQFFAQAISQDWTVWVRLTALFASATLIAFVLFFHSLFPHEASVLMFRLLLSIGLLFGALALLAPITLVTALIFPMALYLVFASLYSLGIVLRAAIHRRTGALVSLLGFIPLLLGNLNDALFFNGLIDSGQMVALGLFLFVFAQAYLLLIRFSRAFVQIETMAEELHLSEEKYRAIFEDSKDLIFITALDGRIEAVNPACVDLLGYTPDEALQLNARDFYADPAERQHFLAAVTEGGSVADFALTLRRKDGRTLESQITATLRYDDTGKVTGYQGIVHDITAYKQAEAHRQRLLALQALNQSLEDRVEGHTSALSKANLALQAEIEQRQMHQTEKDRLLKLAQQQSEHLNTISTWLVTLQQQQRIESPVRMNADIEQKMQVIRQNLSLFYGTALEQDPRLMMYVLDTVRLLAEVETYIEQVTDDPGESIALKDPLENNPLLLLSIRERQVLKLMAEGRKTVEIAEVLTIQLNTVHTYLKRIRSKLNIYDTSGLVAFAREHGLLE